MLFLRPIFPRFAQELAKAGKAWKDDFVTRPVSTPFALKSAMVLKSLSARVLKIHPPASITDPFAQQGELLKKAQVVSPDTVDKTRPLSPRDDRVEALPAKSAAPEPQRQSIFDKKELKRTVQDFDMLKVCVHGFVYTVLVS